MQQEFRPVLELERDAMAAPVAARAIACRDGADGFERSPVGEAQICGREVNKVFRGVPAHRALELRKDRRHSAMVRCRAPFGQREEAC
jgi:hypothetical protein